MELVIMLGIFVSIMARISPEFKKQLAKSKQQFLMFLKS